MPEDSLLDRVLTSMERARDQLWRRRKFSAEVKLLWRALHAKHCLHLLPGESVLEFGAGSGQWTQQLTQICRGENPITAVVFAPEFASEIESRKLPNVSVVPFSADVLPAASFDYVLGCDMLWHGAFPDALAALYRALKPGGRLLFFEPNFFIKPHGLPGSHADAAGRFSRSAERVMHACSDAGYADTELIPYDAVPSAVGARALQWFQFKAVVLQHAPYLRWLCGAMVLSARKPGKRERPLLQIAEHECLRDAVSVVVPCHNEAPNIPGLVSRLIAMYGAYIHEIVIVNDNSTDTTGLVAARLAATEPRINVVNRARPNGVGRALRDGYQAATGRYILSMDCDFVEIMPEFREMFDAVAAGYDGAIGSRFSYESVLVNYPFFKLVCNRGLHLLIKLALMNHVHDITNNLKLYRAEILKELTIESPHFSANLETGLKPLLAGYKVKEVPVSWINRTAEMGISKFKILKVGPDYARVLWHLWKSQRGTPAKARHPEQPSWIKAARE